jgi:predicted metal-dependent HD superfamily phosphohydrolase
MKLDLEQINFHPVDHPEKKEDSVISKNEKRVELLKKAEILAEKLYGDLPYHNFKHAGEAIESGYEIVAKCQSSGIDVDGDVVRFALLFHDAGYHKDHKKEGFSSKEEYSAHLAEEALESLGVLTETIERIKGCIISTHKDKEFNGVEEKIVRAADLAGLACEYDRFKENAMKLKEESEIISGNNISLDDWRKGVEDVIGFYLKQDIKLTECYIDEDGGSVFHNKTKENLEKFMKEKIDN